MSEKIIIDHVTKKYGDFIAIDDVSLIVEPGEFFTLLGPSGCGKTTLLRMIAGFNEIDGGNIYFGDQLINNVPAYKRNIGMVFQNYAIFPHMSVRKNVEYGLRARNVPKNEMIKRANDAMRTTQIEEHADKRPNQLSGGQQQRVALARAIVIRPGLLVMDEPLSNLDAKLRVQMRGNIRELQKSLGITTIYVTHDQEEALAISDRIAVMSAGKIEQLGKPFDLYTNTQNDFVAGFLGVATFIDGIAVHNGFTIMNKYFILKQNMKNGYEGPVKIAVRPGKARLDEPSEDKIQGVIATQMFLGEFINYSVKLENEQLMEINEYLSQDAQLRGIGTKVSISFSGEDINVFTPDGREALT